MKTRLAILLAAVIAPGPGTAGESGVSVHPASPQPGAPFFVRVETIPPWSCSLDGDSFDVSLDGSTLVLALNTGVEACSLEIPARQERSFGAFRLDPAAVVTGERIELVFVTDFPPETELGRTEFIVGTSTEFAAPPRSGIYWDPVFPGNGIALEAHGRALFLAAFTFDAGGVGTWQVAQGEIDNGRFDGALIGVVDGYCLLCRRFLGGPHLDAGTVPVQLVFEGPQAAFFAIGDQPGRALQLRPFALRQVAAGDRVLENLALPDLSGRWLFTNASGAALHRSADLALESESSATGEAVFVSADSGVRMECGPVEGPDRFACRLLVDRVLVGIVSSSDMGPNFIRGEAFVGIRL